MRISCSTASLQTNSWNPENGGTPLEEIGKGYSGFGKYVFLFRFRPFVFDFFLSIFGGRSCGNRGLANPVDCHVGILTVR